MAAGDRVLEKLKNTSSDKLHELLSIPEFDMQTHSHRHEHQPIISDRTHSLPRQHSFLVAWSIFWVRLLVVQRVQIYAPRQAESVGRTVLSLVLLVVLLACFVATTGKNLV